MNRATTRSSNERGGKNHGVPCLECKTYQRSQSQGSEQVSHLAVSEESRKIVSVSSTGAAEWFSPSIDVWPFPLVDRIEDDSSSGSSDSDGSGDFPFLIPETSTGDLTAAPVGTC